jgi:CubicO group peptidase (beta-lactamase class C family)
VSSQSIRLRRAFVALGLSLASAAVPAQEEFPRSPAGAQHLDPQRLARLQHYLPTDARIRSVLIVRKGEIAHEYYRAGLNADDLHNVASVTKSVLSALAGVAIEDKKIAGTEATLGELLPENTARAADPRVKAIQLKHLLTLSAGFDTSATTTPAFLALADFDAVDFVLKRAIVRPPGESFHYNNVDGHLVSAAIGRATGMPAAQYAERTLFRALGITQYKWPADRAGVNIGSGELRLRTRDMAKIGEMFRRQGQWNGQQVVPAAWVAASTSRQSDGGAPLRRPYGYNWWLGNTPDGERPVFFAAGFGGQYIYVVPSLELVVAATSELDGEDTTTGKMIRELLLPAVIR